MTRNSFLSFVLSTCFLGALCKADTLYSQAGLGFLPDSVSGFTITVDIPAASTSFVITDPQDQPTLLIPVNVNPTTFEVNVAVELGETDGGPIFVGQVTSTQMLNVTNTTASVQSFTGTLTYNYMVSASGVPAIDEASDQLLAVASLSSGDQNLYSQQTSVSSGSLSRSSGGRGQCEAHHGGRSTPVILCTGGIENCHFYCGHDGHWGNSGVTPRVHKGG
jgi:hypothetical protein